MALLIRSLSLGLTGLLILALGHKLEVLRQGRAAAEPLMRVGEGRRDHPTLTLSMAVGVEAVVAGSLVVAPDVGLTAFTALALLYLAELLKLAPDEDCHCFGAGGLIGAGTRRAAIIRNIGLAMVCLAVLGAGLVLDIKPSAISGTSLGLALLFLSAVVSAEILARVPWRLGDELEGGPNRVE